MPAATIITVPQLSRLIGLPNAPAVIDVRTDDDYRADPRLLPGSLRRDHRKPAFPAVTPRKAGLSLFVRERRGSGAHKAFGGV